MKTKIFLLFALMITFAACEKYEPLQEINEEFDSTALPVNLAFDYTLIDEDYEAIAEYVYANATTVADTTLGEMVEDNHYFTTSITANEYVPFLMADLFPALGNTSVAKVTYKTGLDAPAEFEEIVNTTYYKLSSEDYAVAGGDVENFNSFTQANPADSYIPTILATNVTDASAGDVYEVKYNYAKDETELALQPTATSIQHTLVADDYQVMVDHVSEISPDDVSSYGTNDYYYGSSSYHVNFDMRDGKWNDAVFGSAQEAVNAAIVYWLTQTYPSATEDGEMYFVTYNYYDGTQSGEKTLVFEVTGTSPLLFEEKPSPEPTTLFTYYAFDGSKWAAIDGSENVYYLSSVDYNSMGAPGNYDNFSSSLKPELFIPNFLSNKFPYALEGDMMDVVYKYYSGSTSTKAQRYIKTAAGWELDASVIEETNQFIHNGQKWLFDPTIRFTMSSSDYQIIVDYVAASENADLVDSYGTAEAYFGSSAYYSEFRLGEDYWDGDAFDTVDDAIEAGIKVMLKAKYSDSPATVEGVDLYYIVDYFVYSGSMVPAAKKFQCTKAGPDPEFTFVEDL